ncbi:MAG TPA: hypothetical protein VK934_00420, partial [Fimbriimonas sp.]|nr:hypothetical protein [Fimbriimonas sp.]
MISALLPALALAQGHAANLLVNGDFEAGPQGFLTAYRQSENIFDQSTFAVTTDPRKQHQNGTSIRDHTSKKGAMLACNGSNERGAIVWQQTVKVQPHTKYEFSGWGTSWSMDPATGEGRDISPALIRVVINGKSTGAVYGVNAKSGSWSRFYYEWDSGPYNTMTIRLIDANIEMT